MAKKFKPTEKLRTHIQTLLKTRCRARNPLLKAACGELSGALKSSHWCS